MIEKEIDIDEIAPTYNPFLCEIVEMMMEANATLDDLTQVLKVNLQTLQCWRKQHPEFDKAITEGLNYEQ